MKADCPVLVKGFRESVSTDPDQTAVVDRNRSVTYCELDHLSGRIASFLGSHGVGPGRRAVLLAEKSIEMVAAALGVLKTGAAYVPLDPAAPVSRTEKQISDCAPEVVFLPPLRGPAVLPRLPASCLTVEVSAGEGTSQSWGRVLNCAPDPPLAPSRPEDPAYLLYTSGSTGEPKGVVISHAAAQAFVGWSARFFELGSTDRVSSHAPLHFDLSIFDIFSSLSCGASVVLVPRELSAFPRSLASFIEKEGITVWYSVPTVLRSLAREGGLREGALASLRLVLFAGEVFPTGHFLHLQSQLPRARFFNLYGPSETNVCTYYEVDSMRPEEQIPIGRPCPFASVRVIGDDGTTVGAGGEGELYVGGESLMSGYWRRPAETARVLTRSLPDGTPCASPVYRTGDRVRVRRDGNLVFRSRLDSMVKRRGYRIELGEIEACLAQEPEIEEAAVLSPPEACGEDETRILAFVVLRDPTEDGIERVRRMVRSNLPDYMQPDEIHLLEHLPRTSRGKVDRSKLVAFETPRSGSADNDNPSP